MVSRSLLLTSVLVTACVSPAEDLPSAWNASAKPARSVDRSADSLTPDARQAAIPCELEPDGGLVAAPEGPFIRQGSFFAGPREGCTLVTHATAGARGSRLQIKLSAWEGVEAATLSVRGLSNELMVGPTLIEAGDPLEVSLDRTGEIFLVLEPSDPKEASNHYALEVHCVEGCEAEYTRYPVLLLHGLGGAATFGDVAYFYGVQEELEPLGYALYTPAVSPFATPQARAAQLEVQLDDLVGQGAGRRFNLIGHSMGGLDARFLAVGLGRVDLVASIVTIGTPHHGTPVADLTHGLVDDAAAVKFWMDFGAAALAELFGQKGEESSLVAALGSMTTEALSEFNAQVPDHEDVYYASWAGVTCGALDVGCQAACEGEIVHPLLAASHFALWLSGTPNDGLVPVESAAWGDYRGELCGDHADEVGLFAGPGSAGFDHLAFYLDEVRRLADLGF